MQNNCPLYNLTCDSLLQSRSALIRSWWNILYINFTLDILYTWKVHARLGLVMICPCLGGWLFMSKSSPRFLPEALRNSVPFAHWYAVISATGKPFWAKPIAGCSRSAKDSYSIHKAQGQLTNSIQAQIFMLDHLRCHTHTLSCTYF